MTRYDETGFEPLPNVSIDDFDAVTEPHEFSATYQARKAALLGEYRAQCMEDARREVAVNSRMNHSRATVQLKRKRPFLWKIAAVAAAAALVVLPAAGFAVANNADFFANAFGTGAHQSIAEHQETLDQGGKTVTVTYPAREYADMDPEEAERLLGDHLMTTPIEMMVGDHKITVLSAVRDDNSAVVHYTVSREGSVTALEFNRLSNEGKGAYIKNDNPYYWRFTAESADETPREFNVCGSFTFVNEERTTNDTVDCYDYLAFSSGIASGTGITLEAWERPTGLGANEDVTSIAAVEIPVTNPLLSTAFVGTNGATVSVSAIAEHLTGSQTLAPDEELGGIDGYRASQLISFDDGTEYRVYDFDQNIDNTSYRLGGERGSYTVFNRLVKPDAITSITINGIEFTR